MRIVIAIGGNALLQRHEAPDAATQRKHLTAAAEALAGITAHNEVVLVHGNGPQVGMLALESESDTHLTRPYPLGDLVAESQGLIGSWIQQELANAGGGQAYTLVTHVVVDAEDPAFDTPTKFIGEVYQEAAAKQLASTHGWSVRPDAGGWRRVVPSPQPRGLIELPAAETLLRLGRTVIIGGGGGIPVTRGDGRQQPVEAVVDKDYVAAVIARQLNAELLVILTDVEGVIADYGTPAATLIRSASSEDLETLALPAGSMGPKVEAACSFIQGSTGTRAAIGALSQAEMVIRGTAGTQITAPVGVRAGQHERVRPPMS